MPLVIHMSGAQVATICANHAGVRTVLIFVVCAAEIIIPASGGLNFHYSVVLPHKDKGGGLQ